MDGRWRVVPRPLTFNKTCLGSTAMYYSFFRKAMGPCMLHSGCETICYNLFRMHTSPKNTRNLMIFFKNMNHLAREEYYADISD
jgi:hypothetical protein